MKKTVLTEITSVVFILALFVTPLSGQSTQKEEAKSTTIPDSVMNIVNISCVACHSTGGNGMAASRVNFSKWDSYSVDKKVSKGEKICDMITRGKMPPKKFISTHPDAVLTESQIKIICSWTQTLQGTK